MDYRAREYTNGAFAAEEEAMARGPRSRDRSSEPTSWVPVGLFPPAAVGPATDGEMVELQERTSSNGEEEFYQHGRQYSSFTQTLLRELPSRAPTGGRTLRRRRGSGSDVAYNTLRSVHSYGGTIRGAIDIARFGDDVDAVVDEIQRGEGDMVDANLARQVELNTLRELERPLSYKRQVKQRLEQRDRQQSRRIGFWTQLSSNFHYSLVQVGRAFSDAFEFVKLWKGHLQRLRGQLGSGVATYFEFLESLFYLNLFTMLAVVGFLMTPQLLLRTHEPREAFASAVGVFVNQTPPGMTAYSGNQPFHFGNLFTGQGWLNTTELYYGFYYRADVALFGGLVYSMPRAYFFTVTICLALQLAFLAVVTARLYRSNFIDASSVSRNVFFNKVLCSWDFSIASEKMAGLRHNAIYNELREMTCDLVRKQRSLVPEDGQPPGPGKMVWAIRCLVNSVIAGTLVGVGFLTRYLLQQQQNVSPGFLRVAAFAVVVTVLVYLLPFAFSALAQLELYGQLRYQVYVTLARTIVLEAVILGVTISFWLDKQTGKQCWESELGQVIYQLVIMEFIFTLVLSLLGEFVRNQLFRAGLTRIGRPKFELASNTMFLVYSQTLVWLGLYFSPLITVIGTVKLFCSFYVKKFSCLSSCEPAANSWRAAQTRTVFQLVAFVSMMAAMAAVGVVVFKVRSSSSCGPFQDLSQPWQVVTDIVDQWNDQLVYYLSYITSPGFAVYVILILCILVYFGRNRARIQQRRVTALRGQLLLEAQDKRLLLRMIDEQSRKLRDSGDDSHAAQSSSDQYAR
ncbi:transmembrane channel-like protein 7 isoform X1 [Amphibalanus amphitrite]|uniref:transmembrane channel-like protein 7 isoform X1 n=2 Tax=Amphibalanus amphitrite TaxID=1232801 RepID=UPI001C90D71E|nr:transmembrane channel-like protein 7 isoform X1 [Amphibalanus amphitrite]